MEEQLETIEMEMTPPIADVVIRFFDIREEVAAGEKQDLGFGITLYRFQVSREKGDRINAFVLECSKEKFTYNLN